MFLTYERIIRVDPVIRRSKALPVAWARGFAEFLPAMTALRGLRVTVGRICIHLAES